MIRALVAGMMIGLIGMPAIGQQALDSAQQTAAAAPSSAGDFVPKQEQLKIVAQYEYVAQRAEATHFNGKDLVKVYVGLGGMYADLAMYPKAKDATERAISLLRQYGPQDQLAAEMGHLAEVDTAMGKDREAEQEDLDALKIRESIGDPVGLALTWSDLASIYVQERQYKKAVDFGQRSLAVIGDDPDVSPTDRIAIRQILGTALCENHDPLRAIPMLKDAVDLASRSFGGNSLSGSIAAYVLGYAYWRSGSVADAAAWMQRGTDQMKPRLGWGHPLYAKAMNTYAQVLRKQGRMEAAAKAESEALGASSVVDARSLTARSSAFAGPSPH